LEKSENHKAAIDAETPARKPAAMVVLRRDNTTHDTQK
jgi:hypothetical protein